MRFSLKLLSKLSEKVRKCDFRWKRRQIKQNLKFSNFWENQFYRKAIAYDKIGGNYALSANSRKICLILAQKFKNWEICWFYHQVCSNTESDKFGKTCLFSEKYDSFVWMFININKVSNSDKKFKFS